MIIHPRGSLQTAVPLGTSVIGKIAIQFNRFLAPARDRATRVLSVATTWRKNPLLFDGPQNLQQVGVEKDVIHV